MIHGARIAERMAAQGLSQSELARRIGISQQSIHKLISGASRGSTHIARIARALGTTPAYLEGEINDPDEGAPPPPPAPTIQHVTLQAVLPSEAALAAAFEGILLASPRMSQAELARELAKRLPTLLRVAGGALVVPASVPDADPAAYQAALGDAHRAPRRASRT